MQGCKTSGSRSTECRVEHTLYPEQKILPTVGLQLCFLLEVGALSRYTGCSMERTLCPEQEILPTVGLWLCFLLGVGALSRYTECSMERTLCIEQENPAWVSVYGSYCYS